MPAKRLSVLLVVPVLVAAWLVFDLGQYLNLAYLKEQRTYIQALTAAYPLRVLGVFFLLYVTIATLSLPGAMIMTVAAGALFAFWQAVLVVSFASSIGATLAFLASRFVFQKAVQRRFGKRLRNINTGIKKDGVYYLLTLRLTPLFPYFIANLVMGLTPIRTRTFYWVTQLGLLPVTFVYVNAGAQLGQLDRLSDVFSLDVIGAFALLALFPWLAKALIAFIQKRMLTE